MMNSRTFRSCSFSSELPKSLSQKERFSSLTTSPSIIFPTSYHHTQLAAQAKDKAAVPLIRPFRKPQIDCREDPRLSSQIGSSGGRSRSSLARSSGLENMGQCPVGNSTNRHSGPSSSRNKGL